MAIVPLVKTTFYGTADQKDAALDELQYLGCVHLINLQSETNHGRPPRFVSEETREALKFLRSCPVRRRAIKNPARFNLETIIEEALEIRSRHAALTEERDRLVRAIRELEPWGDFRLPPKGEFAELRLWFYAIPHYRLKSLANSDLAWQVVSQDHRFAYVIVISPDEPDSMPVPRSQLDDRPLSELTARLEHVESELEDLHWWRVALTRWCHLIYQEIAAADDRAARDYANEQVLDDHQMFAAQGWTPRNDLHRVEDFCRQREFAFTVEEPAADENPPTLLDNAELVAGGEDAVTFYMTPGYRMWDPSSIVFVSFSLFFAMIMSDAGYAAVLGLILLLAWRKLGRSGGGRRFRRLAVAIVLASVGYGVIVGSYFGFAPTEGSLFDKLHVLDGRDMGLMMRLSIIVGVSHLALAHLVTAWHALRSLKVLSSLGWIAILFGGLTVGLGQASAAAKDTLVHNGAIAMISGAIAVLLFSSDRPILTTRLSALGGRLLDGLRSLVGVSRAFGDVLSYLRLFALGLASAQLASTFNDLTYDASCCVGVGMLLGLIVMILGHGLNFALAIMSGVVHGLRLNCIEFFGWGVPEEGYPFRPFCKTAS